MDIATTAQAGLAIVGLVNGVRLARQEDKWGFILFCTAVGAGIIFGYFRFYGLTMETGLSVALQSSGLYRGAEKISGK